MKNDPNWLTFVAAALSQGVRVEDFNELVTQLKELDKSQEMTFLTELSNLIKKQIQLKKQSKEFLEKLLHVWKEKYKSNHIYFKEPFTGYYQNDSVILTSLYFTDNYEDIIIGVKDENEDTINIEMESLEFDLINLITVIYQILFNSNDN